MIYKNAVQLDRQKNIASFLPELHLSFYGALTFLVSLHHICRISYLTALLVNFFIIRNYSLSFTYPSRPALLSVLSSTFDYL
ncbi:hypothetical protein EDB81DRAFT_785793 [Dactylonectria macrodidyma]|uniref:Uncharacterized protein n=1 Tax=Dactylonectria macrodidyma TaxID=307937 RepID=A0A9P9F9J8_9HYPO|nr:hypothetical protein EDB81DRAFT_785793 [Dactylonectria macrodidyma]